MARGEDHDADMALLLEMEDPDEDGGTGDSEFDTYARRALKKGSVKDLKMAIEACLEKNGLLEEKTEDEDDEYEE